MDVGRFRWFPAGFLLVFAAACSQTPTSPSALSGVSVIGATPQSTSEVAPRLSVNPPRALGVTRFVAFGDSITYGTESAFDPKFLFTPAVGGGYPERLQSALNTYHSPQRFTVFNEGHPGEYAVFALSRFRTMLTNRRPEAVLLLEGINDLNNDVTPSRAAAAIRELSDAATIAGAGVVVATMYQTYEVTDLSGTPRPNGAQYVTAFNSELRRVLSGRTNVTILDLYPVIGRNHIGNDGLHLNDAGFQAVTSAFLDAVERAFPVRGSFQ